MDGLLRFLPALHMKKRLVVTHFVLLYSIILMQLGCLAFSTFNPEFSESTLALNQSKMNLIYFREYFIFVNILLFVYVHRLRHSYPDFFTTNIFVDFPANVDQRSAFGYSKVPKIRKMKMNNELVFNMSNESSFNSISSND